MKRLAHSTPAKDSVPCASSEQPRCSSCVHRSTLDTEPRADEASSRRRAADQSSASRLDDKQQDRLHWEQVRYAFAASRTPTSPATDPHFEKNSLAAADARTCAGCAEARPETSGILPSATPVVDAVHKGLIYGQYQCNRVLFLRLSAAIPVARKASSSSHLRSSAIAISSSSHTLPRSPTTGRRTPAWPWSNEKESGQQVVGRGGAPPR
jgi:hypothetical protein